MTTIPGIDDSIVDATLGVVDSGAVIGDQLLAGADPATIDYSNLATSSTALVGTGIATVDADVGNAIIDTSTYVGDST